MNGYAFTLHGASLIACPSGALWWPETRTFVVSDLHLGKSERLARRWGQMLPPYETRDTLARLAGDIAALGPETVICLGDSFDDVQASAALDSADLRMLLGLMEGLRWIWIEGNHDPDPIHLGGQHMAQLYSAPLVFRHIANSGDRAEISGHYHPKARLNIGGHVMTQPCFLLDDDRVVMPAYGAYTGGLRCDDPVLSSLMNPQARAILTGRVARAIPMPRG